MADNFDDPKLLQQAAERLGIQAVIARFGSWAVTTYGIENLERSYPIALSRVNEDDWITHMRLKQWVIIDEFSEALQYGKELLARQKRLSVAGQPLKIFLCHASEDKPRVMELYHQLLALGTAPWLDKDKLLPGQDWRLEIEKALGKTDIVVACLSIVSVAKTGFVQRELKIALDTAAERPEGQIFIIPARLDECEVPASLRKLQRVDLFQKDAFEKLAAALESYAQTRKGAGK